MLRFASNTRSIAYLGWANKGNCGDDAILAACRRVWRSENVKLVPVNLRTIHRGRGSAKVDGILLGGGTVVGRTDWLERIVGAINAYPDVPRFAIGVGVVHPRKCDATTNWVTSAEALKRWAAILSTFDVVSVRGPLSQRVLLQHNIDASVSGDPALLLGGLSSPVLNRKSLNQVLISPGFIETDFYRFSSPLESSLIPIVESLLAEGYRVVLIAMTTTELKYISTYKRRFGNRVTYVLATGPRVLFGHVGRSFFVIAARLHVAIAACAVGVPFLGVRHDPKMDDFLHFVNNHELGVEPGADYVGALYKNLHKYEELTASLQAATGRSGFALRSDVQSAIEVMNR